ncbi:MAG TPA: MFS transporter [Streptosporangiaceae bacterium]|nr:MFS transporter [Streptosporangiaceae bacterium]
MPAATRLLLDVRPLRESPAFRRLWAGSVLSSLGGTMTDFAVTLQVWRLTHAAIAVGLLGLARMIPTLTVAMVGGSLADAVDRRKLVLVTSGCAMAVSAVLAAQAIAGLRQLWLLYVMVVLSASISSITGPARRTFAPRLLSAELLPAGLALNQLMLPVSMIAGPALAGVIAAAGGLQLCYLIDVASFTAALYGVAQLPAMRPQGAGPDRGLRAVAAGVRFIVASRPLAGAFLADLNATVFGLPVALFPAINAERFGGHPQTLGLLTASIGVGGLLGMVFSGPVGRVRRPGRGMLVTVSAWGAGMAVFGVAHLLWLAVGALAAAGGADTITVVFRGMIVQTVIPEGLRGRITAADYVVGYGGGQLGNLESGAVGSLFTPAVSAVSGGLATIAGAALIGLLLPAFTRYRRPLPPGPAGPGRDGLEVDELGRDLPERDETGQAAATA